MHRPYTVLPKTIQLTVSSPVNSAPLASPLPFIFSLVAALGIGAIIAALINLVGNSAAQRRRDARQDLGVRLQLQAMFSDLSVVVQYARDHGIFLRETWNARVARLIARLQEGSTAPALRPRTYRQLLHAASQAEHFAMIMDSPDMQPETPEELRNVYWRRRKRRSDRELRELGAKRRRFAIPQWVEQTLSSIDHALVMLEDDIASRQESFPSRFLKRSLSAVRSALLKERAKRAGIYVARSLYDLDGT